VKILTVRQPWAWAFFSAGKDVENRSRRTNYRGPLAIHVSRFSDWHEIAEDACSMYGLLRSTVLTRAELEQSIGLIIGVVDVIDCVRDSPSRWAIPEQWHWVVANPRSVHPVQIIGQLGIFERELDLEYS
jgi:hypothetical protein